MCLLCLWILPFAPILFIFPILILPLAALTTLITLVIFIKRCISQPNKIKYFYMSISIASIIAFILQPMYAFTIEMGAWNLLFVTSIYEILKHKLPLRHALHFNCTDGSCKANIIK